VGWGCGDSFVCNLEQRAEWQNNDLSYVGYYRNIVVADERCFLISDASSCVKIVPPGTFTGRRVVII
jgi:hypothetical protein